jgi:alkylation response protein AidB-like acyl-CoA dehydrogenase
VWAKLDGVVRGFIVETDRKGFSAPEIKNKFSLRASVTSDLDAGRRRGAEGEHSSRCED